MKPKGDLNQKREGESTKIAANDAVPSRTVLLVELLLDELGDVLLHRVPLDSLQQQTLPLSRKKQSSKRAKKERIIKHQEGAVDGLPLHVVPHIGALDGDFLGLAGDDDGLAVVGGGPAPAPPALLRHLLLGRRSPHSADLTHSIIIVATNKRRRGGVDALSLFVDMPL